MQMESIPMGPKIEQLKVHAWHRVSTPGSLRVVERSAWFSTLTCPFHVLQELTYIHR
jgi:hypothetical protein